MINFWNLKISDGATVSPLASINLEVTEVTLPTISRQFNDDKRVGYIANVPYPMGYELSPLEFTTKALTNTTMRLLARLSRTTFVFTGCESSDGSTFSVTTVTCRGYVEDNPLGTFADDGAEYQVSVRVDYIEVVVDSTTILKFDPTNYVYEVNGTNQLASIKNSLGLGS